MTKSEYGAFGIFFLAILIFYPSGRTTAWAGLFVLNGIATVSRCCGTWGR